MVAGFIPTTGNNKEYSQYLNTGTWSWLTELGRSPPVRQINASVRDTEWTQEFGMKHLKKAEGLIGQKVEYNKDEVNSPNILCNNF